jgi:hypothetical protein
MGLWRCTLLAALCVLHTFVKDTSAESQTGCVLGDSDVVLAAENVFFLPDCSWRCKTTEFTGAGCGETCSNLNSTELSCAKNEYVEPCSAPYQQACRQCRYSENLRFERNEGYLVPAAPFPSNWQTDMLRGAGNFENGKIRSLTDGSRKAVNSLFSVTMFRDVVFLPVTVLERTVENNWFGMGDISLRFSTPSNPRGRGAQDSRSYMELQGPSAYIYRQIPFPGIVVIDGFPANGEGAIIHDYVVSYYWSKSQTGDQLNTITVQLFEDGAVPALNTSVALGTFTHGLVNGDTGVGWRNVHVIMSGVTKTESACMVQISVTGPKPILLDEIRITPSFMYDGDLENRGSYNVQALYWEKHPNVPNGNGWTAYNAQPGIKEKVLARFDAGSYFWMVSGSQIEDEFGPAMLTVLHKAFHSLHGTWATLRMWVIPLEDPVASTKPSILRVILRADVENGASDVKGNMILVKQELTRWDWQLIEVTFPVYSQSYDNDEFLEIMVVSGPSIAFDNVEVIVESGVCPFECDTLKNLVRVNGRCEPCSSEVQCLPGEKTVGCELMSWRNRPVCNACQALGLGASDTSNGAYRLEDIAVYGECWFSCDQGFYFDETRRVCLSCTPVADIFCGVGQFVEACAVRRDTRCSECSTLGVTNPSTIFAGGNLDLNHRNGSEQQQCLAQCAQGFFEWLSSEQVATGQVYNPLCFPCTETICGAKDASTGNRFRNGLQYTSLCTPVSDSKCKSCEADIVGLRGTELVGNGLAKGDFCRYRCAAGMSLCEECRFHEATEPGADSQRHQVLLYADHVATDLWKIDNAFTSMYKRQVVNHPGSAGFDKTYRFSGKAMFSTFPYNTQLTVCLTIVDTHVNFMAWPRTGRECPVTIRPMVAGGREVRNQSFSADIRLYEDFPMLNLYVSNHNTGHPSDPVNYSRLELVWVLSAMPAEGELTLWDFQVEEYVTSSSCCDTPYNCKDCDIDMKVPNSHFVQTLHDSASPTLPAEDQCKWECDTHYEDYMHNQSCLWCETPQCRPDQFFEDCGRCGSCANLPPFASWNSSGTIRGDNTSCVFLCDPLHFRVQQSLTYAACALCSNLSCVSGQQFLEPCSENQDAYCTQCRLCPPGTLDDGACTLETDRTCEACHLGLPDGALWTNLCDFECQAPLVENPQTRTCFRCEPVCVPGFYSLLTCEQESNYTGCMPCRIPRNATAVSSGILFENTCEWECPALFFFDVVTRGCEPLFPAVVVPVRVCATSCLDLVGTKQDPASCACVPCSPDRFNSSSDGVSAWEQRGTCGWLCLFPYMRSGDRCILISDNQDLSDVLGTNLKIGNNTVSSSASAIVILTASVVPILVMLVIVSLKVAL